MSAAAERFLDALDQATQARMDASGHSQRVSWFGYTREQRLAVIGAALALSTSDITRQLIERDAHGQRKYGTSLDRTDLTLGDWLQHQAEELMDGAGYALAAKREYEKLVAERDELRARLDSTGIVTHALIFVSKTQVLEWRKEWMASNPAADGEDHVTPFDGLLYQALPYDKHTQRLRSACSNIKWSEVPLDKLEAIAAVLCEYGA